MKRSYCRAVSYWLGWVVVPLFHFCFSTPHASTHLTHRGRGASELCRAWFCWVGVSVLALRRCDKHHSTALLFCWWCRCRLPRLICSYSFFSLMLSEETSSYSILYLSNYLSLELYTVLSNNNIPENGWLQLYLYKYTFFQ
jgi:hypothetical protein